MRFRRSASTVALTVATAALLAGCGGKAGDQNAGAMSGDTGAAAAMAPAAAQAQGGLAVMVGSHQTTEGNTLLVQPDGSFTAAHNDSVFVHGTMTASGDTITINDDVCKGPGVYVVQGGPNGPTFTLVSDQCKARQGDLTGDSTATSPGT